MRIVYASVLRDIVRASDAAATAGRTIDHIELTFSEFCQVYLELLGRLPTDDDTKGDVLIHGHLVKVDRH